MEYKHIGQCNDLDSLYNEVRINVIRVNNQFCTKPCEEDGECCLDLFDMFDEPTVDISSIIIWLCNLKGLQKRLRMNQKKFICVN